jgi:dihydrolipoamide dehydrogenase
MKKMDKKVFDVVVVGGGPAGYPAAIRAAQNGLSVACIDEWKNRDGSSAFGGTCLYAGCIPSKALLESTELYYRAASEFKAHGIGISDLAIDIDTMQSRKKKIVKQLTGGIEALFKSNGVTPFKGHGRLLPENHVEVTSADGQISVLIAKNVIIATGSIPIELPIARFDNQLIVDSWGALEFDSVPKTLGVIGAGVIGLELGSVWQRLGARVVMLEALDEFLPMVDGQIAKEARRFFKRQGLDIRLGSKVSGAKINGDAVTVTYEDVNGSNSLEVDKLIVCVGRKPFTNELFAPGVNVALDDKGFVEVDEHCSTSLPQVWAVGDVVRGPMLAHKGTEEGVMVADLIAGKVGEVNYDAIPSVIYTAPEISWVGKTESEVKETGRPYKVGTFSFSANGRAKGMEQTEGLVKLITDKSDDELLGVHIVGAMAGELIAEAVLAIEFSASGEDLQRICHAHPTLTEAIHEAALAADGRAIHAINR